MRRVTDNVQKFEIHHSLPAAAGSGRRIGPVAGTVHGPQQHHFADQRHAPADGPADQQTDLHALADREPVCRFGGDGFAGRTCHTAAGQGAGSAFGLHSGCRDAAAERTAGGRVRRHRRGLQHGHRHGDRAERHPAGTERQGRNQGRRPHHRDQRHARGGTEDSAARRGEETARSARHDSAPRTRTAGNRRAGWRRCRTRQDSDQEHRIGIPHRRRHRLHQTGAVRPHHLRGDGAGAGFAAGGRRHQTDLRPQGQFGRLSRSGDSGRQRIPAQGAADRLY